MTIRTVLADDEALARLKLSHLLRSEPEIKVVGECATASEAIELVRSAQPELLFLDIRMPGMDGFDVLREIAASMGNAMPHVVFTTAYESYAVRAFDVHAVDYLLKPFTVERLRSAIQHAREQIVKASRNAGRSNEHAENGKTRTNRIVFKSRGRILFLPVSEIRWIGAEENYVRICTGAETHLLRETMSGLEERLDPQMFLRVHRSAIVNLHYVKEVRTEPQGDFTVLLANGQKVAMSRSYHTRIGDLLTAS